MDIAIDILISLYSKYFLIILTVRLLFSISHILTIRGCDMQSAANINRITEKAALDINYDCTVDMHLAPPVTYLDISFLIHEYAKTD